MTGTLEGGLKAGVTNKKKHGEDFYKRIGAMGGRAGHTGGFAANPALARIAGRKGGKKSSRAGIANGEGKTRRWRKGVDELQESIKEENNGKEVQNN